MVKDRVISLNHLSRGDYSRGAKYQNSCLRFVNVTQELINAMEESTILKSIKYAMKFCVTLFKRKM